MSHIDEVKRLNELEAKATCAPWDLLGKIDFQIVADKPDFYISFEDSDREDPQLITDLRNAAPWLLKVAGKFQKGDGDAIETALMMVEAIPDDDKALWPNRYKHAVDCLRRLAEAAEIMEGQA